VGVASSLMNEIANLRFPIQPVITSDTSHLQYCRRWQWKMWYWLCTLQAFSTLHSSDAHVSFKDMRTHTLILIYYLIRYVFASIFSRTSDVLGESAF